MRGIIFPSKLFGEVQAPASKSETHRAVLLSALSKGDSEIFSPLISGDTLATIYAAKKFGAEIFFDEKKICVTGGELHSGGSIDCKNSGTTMRLCCAVAAKLSGTTEFFGDASLNKRPMGELFSALEELGAEVVSESNHAPFFVTGPADKNQTHISGMVSSQFISALLIAAPLTTNATTICVTTEIISRPYLEMTISLMQKHGVFVEKIPNGFFIPENSRYQPASYQIEGDYSSAAYLLVAGVLAGEVMVTGVSPESLQGDKEILKILEKFGAEVLQSENSVTVKKSGLTGATINLSDTPDLFPALAVLATQAKGTTTFFGAAHLRSKESDRISEMAAVLKKMNANISETSDGCKITGPTKLSGANFSNLSDHRIVMAAVLAGVIADGKTCIEHLENIQVSYPNFLSDLKKLGADLKEL